MTDRTTTTPAFVRTETGVVRVGQGQLIPAGTLPTEITRLTAAGVLVEVQPQAPEQPAGDDLAAADNSADAAPQPEPVKAGGKGRRGQSGRSSTSTTQED